MNTNDFAGGIALDQGASVYVCGTSSYVNQGTSWDAVTLGYLKNIDPDKELNLKFYLEGLYSGGGLMNKAQDQNGDHFGSDTADIVTVEFHNSVTYANIEYAFTNVKLQTNGQASITGIPYTINGNYYITVKHRNSIETTTASPVSFAGNNIVYDFSTAATQAYGSNQKDEGGVYAFYGGDVNQDGNVDTTDMTPVDNDSANFASGCFVNSWYSFFMVKIYGDAGSNEDILYVTEHFQYFFVKILNHF